MLYQQLTFGAEVEAEARTPTPIRPPATAPRPRQRRGTNKQHQRLVQLVFDSEGQICAFSPTPRTASRS